MKKNLLLLILLFNIVNYSNALRKITTKDFIDAALQNNNFKEILAKETTLIYQEQLSTPASDLVMSVSNEYNLNTNTNLLNGYNGSISLSKLFPLSQTNLSTKYSGTISKNGQNIESKFAISIEQDVIKNAFGKTSRIKKKIAGMESEIARIQIIETYEAYIATLLTMYFNWYSNYETLQIAKKSFSDSKELYANTQNKFKYGIASNIDLYRSELQVATKKEQFLKSTQQFDSMTYKIKSVMLLDESDDIIPTYHFNTNGINFDHANYINNLKEDNRSMMILNLFEKKSKMNLLVFKDALLPKGLLYTDYALNTSTANFNFGGTAIINELTLGFKIDISPYSPYAKANYNLTKLQREITLLANSNEFDNLKEYLNLLFANIKNLQKLIRESNAMVQLSRKIVNEETKNYANGKSSTKDIIDAYNTVDSYKLKQITYQVEYIINYIIYLRDTDTLVTKDKHLNF